MNQPCRTRARRRLPVAPRSPQAPVMPACDVPASRSASDLWGHPFCSASPLTCPGSIPCPMQQRRDRSCSPAWGKALPPPPILVNMGVHQNPGGHPTLGAHPNLGAHPTPSSHPTSPCLLPPLWGCRQVFSHADPSQHPDVLGVSHGEEMLSRPPAPRKPGRTQL